MSEEHGSTASVDVVYETDVYDVAGGLRRMHVGDAGMDLRTVAPVIVPAHGYAVADVGIRIRLPHGTFGAIRSRSGLASRRGISTIEGTIDENFTGRVLVTLVSHADEDVTFEAGDRVSQLVVIPYVVADARRVDALEENADRGDAGYGSSGLA